MSALLRVAFGLAIGVVVIGSSMAQHLSVFRCQPAESHVVVLVFEGRPVDLQEMRGQVARYLWDQWVGHQLKLTHTRVGRNHVLLIEHFAQWSDAQSFIDRMKRDRPVFLQTGLVWEIWAVSRPNFEKILQANSFKGYLKFYHSCYDDK